MDAIIFKANVSRACQNLIDAEPDITRFDTIVGDGDCGETLARGARAVLAFLDSPGMSDDAVSTLLHITNVIEDNMDGTSGAIYGIFFAALAAKVRSLPPHTQFLNTKTWGKVAKCALTSLQLATPARTGDRTLMDALEPFIEGLAAGDTVDNAVAKARVGVEATKGMKAAFGRAVYVEESAWSVVPDPGAEGVLCILQGFIGV